MDNVAWRRIDPLDLNKVKDVANNWATGNWQLGASEWPKTSGIEDAISG